MAVILKKTQKIARSHARNERTNVEIGRSGRKDTNPNQGIAISPSEAREEGEGVPKKKE